MSVDCPSLQSAPCYRVAHFLADASTFNTTEMYASDLIAAVASDWFELDDTTSMYSTLFCRVCPNDNQNTSRCHQVNNIASFICTRNKNFEYWRDRQEYINERLRQTSGYRQCRQSVWQKWKGSLSANRKEPRQRAPKAKTTTTLTTVMLCAQVHLRRTEPVQKITHYG